MISIFMYSNFYLELFQHQFNQLYIFLLNVTILTYDNKTLNPWYVTGYSDGDSSFWVSINPNNKFLFSVI